MTPQPVVLGHVVATLGQMKRQFGEPTLFDSGNVAEEFRTAIDGSAVQIQRRYSLPNQRKPSPLGDWDLIVWTVVGIDRAAVFAVSDRVCSGSTPTNVGLLFGNPWKEVSA